MTLNNPEAQLKLLEWQDELRKMTNNSEIILQAYAPVKFTAEQIIEMVCEETGIEYAAIVKKSKKREVVVARQLIAFYCKNCTGMSLRAIGELIGGRDHTTVIHAVNTINDLLESNNIAVVLPVTRINKRLESH